MTKAVPIPTTRTSTAPTPTSPTPVVGSPVPGVDGPLKVTGAARYAAENAPPGLTYAALVLSTVPTGRITSIDVGEAEAAPGVLRVLTHLNAPRLAFLPAEERAPVEPASGTTLRALQGPQVAQLSSAQLREGRPGPRSPPEAPRA